MHKNQKKWDEYVTKWTWERAYKRMFLLRFTLLLIALVLTSVLAYMYFCVLPRYEEAYANNVVEGSAVKVHQGNPVANAALNTASWNTYVDKDLGFEIQYPRNLSKISATEAGYPGIKFEDAHSRYSVAVSVDHSKSNSSFVKMYPTSGSVVGYAAKVLDSSDLRAANSDSRTSVFRTAALLGNSATVYLSLNVNDSAKEEFYKNEFQHMLLTLKLNK